MSPRLRNFFQYVIILAVTVALTWYSLSSIPTSENQNRWDYIISKWQTADKSWLVIMALLAMVSHAIRAERWRMLLVPVGHDVKFKNSFLSLMVGYLVNLAIPRGGEVSRCYNLYKLDKVPVDISFGTVVVERIIDLICLMLLLAVSFVLESKRLFEFIDTLPISATERLRFLLYAGGVALAGLALVLWFINKNQKARDFITKTWIGVKKGLLSIFELKNKGRFILYTVAIWALYFMTSFAVLKAFPSTSGLGLGAVLSLFAIGSIAMTLPLPAGMGSYHVLVPQGLMFLYNLPREDAVAFTVIFHGWQTLLMIVVGAISLLITSYLVKNKSRLH